MHTDVMDILVFTNIVKWQDERNSTLILLEIKKKKLANRDERDWDDPI